MVLLAAVTALAVGLVGWTVLRPDAEPVDQARPGPVVVVPGYGARTGSVEPLRQALADLGRTAVVLDPPGDGTGDLREQAEALAALVERTRAEAGAASVDLVGYSAGGVVARLYVRDLDGADVVRRVVTVGSPHHGTETANLALQAAGTCPPACEQLAVDSDLLRALNAGDETPDGPLWATVRTSEDEVVVPVDSAALTGATDVLVQDLCPTAATGHGDLPADPVTQAVVAAALGVAPPEVPADVRC